MRFYRDRQEGTELSETGTPRTVLSSKSDRGPEARWGRGRERVRRGGLRSKADDQFPGLSKVQQPVLFS